jgi:tRNA-2-methylthio-N6-dimethylallyladenosine synthase
MNAHDSEKLAGILRSMGLAESPRREEADFVLFNTCCIRDNAERRALGNVNWLKEIKKERPSLLIGVCGCMVQQAHMAEGILKQYKFIDLAFGTHNMHELPSLLYQLVEEKHRVVSVSEQENLIAEGVPVQRLNPHHAFITIMYGCDNFCSYCVVPYVRGRERSRRTLDILREAEELQKTGVQEIMLLGQNVNSYQGGPGETFPGLLKALDQIGIPRIRFMTSHPKDLSDELIQVMADSRHLCNHLHLPVQSGNDEVLKAMNRGYTRAAYMDKVLKLREAMPQIGLTTDFIVGFPGETEAQFEDSLSLVEEVGYDAAFSFVFSPRKGTRAALLPEQVEAFVSSRRMDRLLEALGKSTAQAYQGMIGKTEQVLVETISKRNQGQVSGKGTRSITITLDGTQEDIGRIVPVTITSAAANTLRGERIKGE